MARTDRKGPPPPPDPDAGTWQGRSVARRFVSPDGMTVLVGRTAEDNDTLTLRLGRARDTLVHVPRGPGPRAPGLPSAGERASHVVVRNPHGLSRLPRETLHFAAALAARYSKARRGGR